MNRRSEELFLFIWVTGHNEIFYVCIDNYNSVLSADIDVTLLMYIMNSWINSHEDRAVVPAQFTTTNNTTVFS